MTDAVSQKTGGANSIVEIPVSGMVVPDDLELTTVVRLGMIKIDPNRGENH